MEYYITTLEGNERRIISKHSTLQEALDTGENVWRNAPKGISVSCITGTVNEDGRLSGKYQLYQSWF